MEDVKIMENMKEVLKKARKAKHKKPRSHQKPDDSESQGDSISEILNQKWMFSSPPATAKTEEETKISPRVDAFALMMKKPEPLSQISPEVNGVKKKRKYTRKPKYNKLDSDNGNTSDITLIDENSEGPKSEKLKNSNGSTNGVIKLLKEEAEGVEDEGEKAVEETRAEEEPTKKRIRSAETDIVTSVCKKRKSDKFELDSNGNSHGTPTKEAPEEEVKTPTYQSGRPRRSCAGKISYDLVVSPDKASSSEASQKRQTRSSKKADDDEAFVIDDDSPEKDKKPRKLAPLFVKKVPKPAIDPVVKAARRTFLLSGLPEDMRNSIDKQRQYEDEIVSNDLIAFPSISHITQRRDDELNGITAAMWKKSRVQIKADDEESDDVHRSQFKRGMFTECSGDEVVAVISDEIRSVERTPIENVKKIVKEMKQEFDTFPTNRCFKQLHSKYQNTKGESPDSDDINENESDKNLLFVDIFKPESFEEFLVNLKPIKELQKFLLSWNDKTDTDYDSDDSSSRRSTQEMNNFAVLTGGGGGGKTSSVYALAESLNYRVIEINAGSRRSGKKMLQDLLEATQSHRVKDKSGKLFTSSEETENSQESNCDASPGAKSIILIEDAELVFEADDGFVSSIQQLINISKRPVLLTTNTRTCQHLQKFIQHNEIMFERPKNVNHIGKYLSLLCLAANYQISAAAIEQLYVLNGHDLRKTINVIEFFIRSGNTRGNGGDLMDLYRQPRREWSNKHQLNYGIKSLSTICFESSIVSSFATMSRERADDGEVSYQQRQLTDEIDEYLFERNAVEAQRDSAGGEQKLISR